MDLCNFILKHGEERGDRTGTGTLAYFAPPELEFDLGEGFPLVTTKKIYHHAIVTELMWFLSGRTDLAYLQEHNVHIWDANAKEKGDLGPIYGFQWRHWGGDQIATLLKNLQDSPQSRRHIVSAWNAEQLKLMALEPCHVLFQCYVSNSGHLSLKVYQRSCDLFLGVPFNIASYALLTHMLAYAVGLRAGRLIWTGGDVHIYNDHIEQVKEQVKREPKPLCSLVHPADQRIFEWKPNSIVFNNYQYHPPIKGAMSV